MACTRTRSGFSSVASQTPDKQQGHSRFARLPRPSAPVTRGAVPGCGKRSKRASVLLTHTARISGTPGIGAEDSARLAQVFAVAVGFSR